MWLVGAASVLRSQPDLQYFYVNGRAIRDKLISHAVRLAFQDVLHHSRHPAYVLYLTVDPASVDVNVHPTKHEVRFRDSRRIHDFVFRSLARALAELRPDSELRDRTATADFSSTAQQQPFQNRMPLLDAARDVRQSLPQYAALYTPQAVPAAQLDSAAGVLKTPPNFLQANTENAEEVPLLGYAIAQLKGIYILAENAQGLVLVDTHAAHERITYERLKNAYDAQKIACQPLLVPQQVSVSEREADCAEEQRAFFANWAYKWDRVGPESLLIRTTSWCCCCRAIVNNYCAIFCQICCNTAPPRVFVNGERSAVDHGLSRLCACESPYDAARNECLVARYGNHRAQRSMQSRPPNMDTSESR